jgi:NADH dehydrogenase FAD-containing subunit
MKAGISDAAGELAQVKSQRLLLIGGGHAHVAVLADWIAHGQPAGAQAVLLTPEPTLRYSGMVPGWIAGQHTSEAGLVDLVALARRAGAELVQDRCAAIDPDARTVTTAGGRDRLRPCIDRYRWRGAGAGGAGR